MLKSRLIVLVVAIIVVIGLFLLPKIVVDNDNEQLEEATTTEVKKDSENTVELDSQHQSGISEEMQLQIDQLRNNYLSAKNKEKSAIFADSLALLFKEASKLDSAAKYTELATNNLEAVGDAYYDAFSFAVDAKKANELGAKVRFYYQKILADDASRLDIKTKIAMTYVSTDNPMSGIMMLREVLESDPTNEEALFNLGVLSIQSGQYKNAIERFDQLLENHPDNEQAMFYLALSYFNDGQRPKAKELFEKIKNTSKDEQVLAAVDSYLNELK